MINNIWGCYTMILSDRVCGMEQKYITKNRISFLLFLENHFHACSFWWLPPGPCQGDSSFTHEATSNGVGLWCDIFFIWCQLSFNMWTPSCNTFPKIRVWIKQLMVVILKGYKDGKVFGANIMLNRYHLLMFPRFFMMTKNYIPRPQCQFILVTDHQTPLTMATMANSKAGC